MSEPVMRGAAQGQVGGDIEAAACDFDEVMEVKVAGLQAALAVGAGVSAAPADPLDDGVLHAGSVNSLSEPHVPKRAGRKELPFHFH